jgi:hypothetical protein
LIIVSPLRNSNPPLHAEWSCEFFCMRYPSRQTGAFVRTRKIMDVIMSCEVVSCESIKQSYIGAYCVGHGTTPEPNLSTRKRRGRWRGDSLRSCARTWLVRATQTGPSSKPPMPVINRWSELRNIISHLDTERVPSHKLRESELNTVSLRMFYEARTAWCSYAQKGLQWA